jgi:hypothetical protein
MFLEEEKVWMVSDADVRAFRIMIIDNLSDSQSICPSRSVSLELGDTSVRLGR